MAYGARLESVLGESPRGFESPILRGMKKPPIKGVFSFPGFGGFVFEPGFLVPRPLATHRVAARDPHSPPSKKRSHCGSAFLMFEL